MESSAEARRLAEQARSLPVRQHLRLTGLSEGMVALDAGCGPGVITGLMAELVGPRGRVVGLDVSAERLAEARAHCAHLPQCEFVQADVRATGMQDASVDYAWCQFVFEYLRRPEEALGELIRVTRPGGHVVVSDMDGVGMLNWPCPPDVEDGFRRLVQAVSEATGYDPHVGRKMFHLFRRAGLADVRVHMLPLWMVTGAADARLLEDWAIRFRTLEPIAAPALGGTEAYWAFCERYMGMLRDPEALKYSVVLITEGRKS